MRSAWLLILPFVVGCSGRHVVAGEEKTKKEQLSESLPAWCEQVCANMSGCSQGARLDLADCIAECREALRRYTLGGEACASLGEQFQMCLDGLSCAELFGDEAERCEPKALAQSVCGEDDAPSEPIPMTGTAGTVAGGGTSSTGGTTTTPVGGTAAVGGSALGGMPAGGGTSPGAAGSGPELEVTCALSASNTYPASSGVVCEEEERMACSDGHKYRWRCARDANLSLVCSCFVDEQFAGGFAPLTGECPALERVNEGCGFSLAQ